MIADVIVDKIKKVPNIKAPILTSFGLVYNILINLIINRTDKRSESLSPVTDPGNGIMSIFGKK